MPRTVPTSLYLLLLLVLIIANVSTYRVIFAVPTLEVKVLDVGEKGSATLVRTPSGAAILIDTGPDASILRALGMVLPMWQKRIDAVILTSTKTAFVGGLSDVEKRYHIPNIIHAGDNIAPYGTRFALDNVSVDIISPGTLNISYGATLFSISSTTPKGAHISDGKIVTQK